MTKALAKPLDPSVRLKDKRQERFCQEYMLDLNATQAYMRAGYKAKNANVAGVLAHRLLRDAKVDARLKYLEDERARLVGLTGETILRGLYEIATVDLADAMDDKGNWLPVNKMPPHVRRCLIGVDVVEMAGGMAIEVGKPGSDGAESGGIAHVSLHTKKLKVADKLKAWELLAKHKGLVTERKEVSGVVKHDHTHRLSKEQADAAYRAAGLLPPIEGEAVPA